MSSKIFYNKSFLSARKHLCTLILWEPTLFEKAPNPTLRHWHSLAEASSPSFAFGSMSSYSWMQPFGSPFFLKICHVWGGSACLSLAGSQRWGSLLTKELRSFTGKHGASKWTHILVRHPADPQMPSIEKGPNCHSKKHSTPQRMPDLADFIVPTSFPTNLAFSLPPGHLLSVDGSGNWARISMPSLYWLPSILIFTVFSLCQEKFLTKGNAIQSWLLSKL